MLTPAKEGLRLLSSRARFNLIAGSLGVGANIYLRPGLHAKGIVTPLGVVTGTTITPTMAYIC